MLKPVHLEEWRSLFPLQRAMPIESPPASVAMTCSVTLLAITIGRRWFVTSVSVAVARKSAFASEAPSESMSLLSISYERPPDVKRISTWPDGPLDVLNLMSKSKYSRVPEVAAYTPPEDEARMLPRPLVWLSFGAGDPVGVTTRTRPTPVPT